jgi:hypothetical protein
MADLSDKPMPLVVYNIPGIGTAQLCSAQLMDDASCINFPADLGYPPAITSGQYPHRYRH